jgi:hypothetical protein
MDETGPITTSDQHPLFLLLAVMAGDPLCSLGVASGHAPERVGAGVGVLLHLEVVEAQPEVAQQRVAQVLQLACPTPQEEVRRGGGCTRLRHGKASAGLARAPHHAEHGQNQGG